MWQVVPRLIKEKCGEELKYMKTLVVQGDRFFVFYDSDEGLLYPLDEVIHYYKVKKNEIIIFKLEDNNVLNGRLYQSDGLEIDYYRRTFENPKYTDNDCFWNFECMAIPGKFKFAT